MYGLGIKLKALSFGKSYYNPRVGVRSFVVVLEPFFKFVLSPLVVYHLIQFLSSLGLRV